MFKELGAIMSLMKNAGEMKEKMQLLKENLSKTRATGSAGEGKVIITINGENQVVGCMIDEELLTPSRKDELEEYIVQATNIGLKQVQTAAADEMMKLTGGLNLPSGLGSLLG